MHGWSVIAGLKGKRTFVGLVLSSRYYRASTVRLESDVVTEEAPSSDEMEECYSMLACFAPEPQPRSV